MGEVSERSALRLLDALDEVVASIVQRPGRALLTALGTALGLAAFVSVVGLTATASGQVSARFTALAATEVTLERQAVGVFDESAFPVEAQHRVAELSGVREVGVSWPVPLVERVVRARPKGVDDTGEGLAVTAASPGYLKAIHARNGAGVLFDSVHDSRAERVAVLGHAAARRLGISRLDAQPAVFIDGHAFTVIGVIDAVDRDPDVLLSVLLPDQTVRQLWGEAPAPGNVTRMLVETDLGAAQQVGRQAKVAARPDSPELTTANVPPDPRTLRDQVATDLDTLFLGLAGVSLLIGAVGIANTSLVAVLERVNEIGLRRALGARRRHIGLQFLLESAALGLLGGVVGTAIGIVAVLVVAVAQQWTPLLEPWLVYPAPLVGALTGLLAGVYPAWRASRIEPVEALRR